MQPIKPEKTDHEPTLTVWIFNVGKGDNILIRLPNGLYLIIDFYFKKGKTDEAPALTFLKHAVTEPISLTLVNITHFDKDHYWGASDFLDWGQRQSCLEHCAILYSSAYSLEDVVSYIKTYNKKPTKRQALMMAIDEFGNSRHVTGIEGIPELTDRPTLEGYVLSPLPEEVSRFNAKGGEGEKPDPNAISTALKIKFLNYTLIFGADLPDKQWNDVFTFREKHALDYIQFNADFIKASHHGATNASSISLWRTLCKLKEPTRIVFTVDEHYPTQETIGHLNALDYTQLFKYVTNLADSFDRGNPKQINWKANPATDSHIRQNQGSYTLQSLSLQSNPFGQEGQTTENTVNEFIGFEFNFSASDLEIFELYSN